MADNPKQDVARLWENVTAFNDELAAQRFRLGRQWIADQLECQQKHAIAVALEASCEQWHAQFIRVCEEFGAFPAPHTPLERIPIPSTDLRQWITRSGDTRGIWALSPIQVREFDIDLSKARSRLSEARERRFGSGPRKAGEEALGTIAARLHVLEQLRERADDEAREAEVVRDANAAEAGARAFRALEVLATKARVAADALPAVLQPWTSDAWRNWTPEDISSGLSFAFGGVLTPTEDPHLGRNATFGTDFRLPWALSLHENLFISFDAPNRDLANGLVRSLMMRQLASVAPGALQLCIYDPVGLGQSAGDLLDLAEYDPNLISGKVWTSPQDLNARLAELSAHTELVIQKYLRTTYHTLAEFNDAAGDLAEPFRMLVLFDFPSGLTAEAAARLKSIAENGPRCGVFTVIAANSGIRPPHGVEPVQVEASMRSLNLQALISHNMNGYQLQTTFEPDILPERSVVARRVIDAVGRATIAKTATAVTFEKIFDLYGRVAARGLKPELGDAEATTKASDPRTWWKGDSTRGLFAPIGQVGARDVAVLGFDSSDHSGALVVGRHGSGKSTLLHTYIGGITTLYSPDELELYLIDFKEGVEFETYAECGLPHAKIVAIESDREFGLSVLESVQTEISQRATQLRSTGGKHAGLKTLREATHQKMPRLVLIFDEFQVLFSRNDKVGLAAAELLESIIGQGRGFGVHVLLGSQSLAGLDTLGAHLPQQLPVRILLAATETDTRRVLGDGNTGGDYLTTRGEGILNTAGGSVEANQRFKGAVLAEADRVARLQIMREKADQAGFSRKPVIFEGNSLIPLDSQDPRLFREELTASGSNSVRVRSGAPMAGGVGDVVLYREAGANILAIVRSGDSEDDGVAVASGPAYGLLATAVASGAMTESDVDVIDFMSIDDGLDALLEPLLNAGRITLRRRRGFANLLDTYLTEVSERLGQDDLRREARILYLFGVHRARELNADAKSLDVDGDLMEKLESIMRDGPEVGVHLWLWADSVAGVSRRLTPRMMREVGWRIAGKMSADDSHMFIGTSQASELRNGQLILANEDRGISTLVTAYAPPSSDWLTTAVGAPRFQPKN